MLRSIKSALVLAPAMLLASAQSAPAQVMAIATNPQGTLGYSTGVAMAKLLSDKAGLNTQPIPVGGSSTYIPQINRGEMEFGFANVGESHWAYLGEAIFAGKPNQNLRLVLITYPITNALTVRGDAPIKRIADLKGMRVPSEYTSQTIFRIMQEGLLASGGLSMADVTKVPVRNFVEAMKQLGGGRVDVAPTGQSTGIALETHASLSRNNGIRHLPIETTPDAIKRMRDIFPGMYVSTLKPAPSMPGVVTEMPTWTHANFLLAGAHVSEDVVYKVIKAMHANKDALVAGFALFNEFEPSRMNQPHVAPYHPGAIKFYQEVKQWPPKER